MTKDRKKPSPARARSVPQADSDAMGDMSKGDARRLHLLETAAQCFREHGFHGSSIAKISEASGMSAGHIYHYFKNKEAIVEGIVERDLQGVLDRAHALREASRSIGIVQACMAQVDSAIALRADKDPAALGLEILAEASRNAEVARMLEEADARSRQSTMELLGQLGSIKDIPPKDKAARITVLHALFDGLSVRSLVDPALNRAATSKVIKRVMRLLLEDPDLD